MVPDDAVVVEVRRRVEPKRYALLPSTNAISEDVGLQVPVALSSDIVGFVAQEFEVNFSVVGSCRRYLMKQPSI